MPSPLHSLCPDSLIRTIAAAPEAGGSTLVQMMATLGVLLLSFTTLMLLRRRIRRQAHDRGLSVQDRIRGVREQAQRSAGAPASTARASAASRASIESVMADAEELTRRLAAVMDNKAAALEILIDRANEAAQRLERANVQADGDHRTRPVSAPMAQLSDPLANEVYALADQGRTSLEIARELDEPTGKVELILALRRPATPHGAGSTPN